MVAIEFRAFLKRFEGYEEALFETQLVDLNARAEKKKRLECVEYCLLIWWRCVLRTKLQCCKSESMRPLMLIFMLITNLWKMLEARFTQERINKIQGYLNKIGRVKHEANEDFKIFVDRFKKLIGDFRSIDPKQVPTDVNLMGVLK